jgi:hypothetical protein
MRNRGVWGVDYGSDIDVVAMIADNKVKIQPWLKEGVTIEYSYTVTQAYLTMDSVSATDTPNVKLEDRHILADMALQLLYYDWEDKASVSPKIDRLGNNIEKKLREMKKFYLPMGFSQLSA